MSKHVVNIELSLDLPDDVTPESLYCSIGDLLSGKGGMGIPVTDMNGRVRQISSFQAKFKQPEKLLWKCDLFDNPYLKTERTYK